jgi:hypothetical protein
MKRKILTYSDSNMAGFSWRWGFYLEDKAGSTYKLSCKQTIYNNEDDDEDNEPLTIEPVFGLRRGADVFDALWGMVSEAGYSLEKNDVLEIAAELAKLNGTLANQFKRASRSYLLYTKAEEDEFYRRVSGGPVTIVRSADDRKGQKSQEQQQRSRPAKRSP